MFKQSGDGGECFMQPTADTVTSYIGEIMALKKELKENQGLESSEVVRWWGQVGNQTIQGFGSLIKDFGPS